VLIGAAEYLVRTEIARARRTAEILQPRHGEEGR
jgi:hypothetical protein